MAKLTGETLRQSAKDLPEKPGVYFFRDRSGRAVYIGKARSLRKRVLSHLRHAGEPHSKEGRMLAESARIDVLETPTEAEALLLEASLVRESQPKYNQLLKDDKSYPYLKVTSEEFPRLVIARGRRADGAAYFGPYTGAGLLKQAIALLRRLFPMRTCKSLPDKVCLMYHIGQCKGPCAGHQDSKDYAATVRELKGFLEGRRDTILRTLLRRMKEHAARREYEEARALREQVRALSSVPQPPAAARPAREALRDAAAALSLDRPPERIECFDISNVSGVSAVASMVVFVGGEAAPDQYRRFRIRTVRGIDDYRMMREAVGRRYRRLLAEGGALPDLVVIDGGLGHLNAARAELEGLGLGRLPAVGIAKQHEHLYAPWKQGPYVFAPGSPALQLIQRLRDEAHRFAITYHRRLHRRRTIATQLDEIPGIGPRTRARLLRRYGSLAQIRRQTPESLREDAGLDPRVAAALLDALGGRPA